jgi:phage-related protein
VLIAWEGANGTTIEFREPSIILESWTGFAGPARTHQTQKAVGQIGSSLLDTLYEQRELSIRAVLVAETRQDLFAMRRILIAALIGEGTLTWTQDDGTAYVIACVADSGTPRFVGDAGNQSTFHMRFYLDLLAPDPTWYDPVGEEQHMNSFEGGMTIPFELPLDLGTVGASAIIRNKGDLATPVLITITGPVTNPSIENLTTDQTIALVLDIAAGETLVISTVYGSIAATLTDALGVETNAMRYITVDSEFWQLQPGANEVSYASSGESGSAEVVIGWRHRYAGV